MPSDTLRVECRETARRTIRLLVLNPNTTAAMTQSIAACARSVAQPGTQIVGRNPETGPASIEGADDHARCLQPMLAEIARGERDGCDATIIACFDDPGLVAARRLAAGPVIGIAQAAMQGAAIVAVRFGIVTTVDPAVPVIEELVVRYGATHSCVAVRAAGVPVLSLEQASAAIYTRVRDCAARMLLDDRADAIVLGCAGMSALGARLARDLAVPIIDGVAIAVKTTEGLVALGLRMSKRADYAAPHATQLTTNAARIP